MPDLAAATPSSAHASFAAARAFLLAHRGRHAEAVAGFAWPRLHTFNWALDWFDVHAAGNTRIALHVVDEHGAEERITFAEMAARSARVANWLRAQGVARGDRVLVMLGNVVPLWEVTLAAIKLGAVISPATTLLAGSDLEDRIVRGGMKHVIADAGALARFEAIGAAFTRIAVPAGDAAVPPGWIDWRGHAAASDTFQPAGDTLATDPLLLYFTSGTTAKPKMVLHTHQSYPVGHLSTMYWLGLREGDVHWNISSPGWGKHAWSSFYAPWNAGATIFVFNQARFDAKRTLAALVAHGVTSLCAPPTVWRTLILEDLARWPVKLSEVIGAGEPLNPEVIERVRAAWGLVLRDGYGQTESTCQVGNPPGLAVRAGSMGQPMPGFTMALLDAEGRELPAGEEGELAITLGGHRPLGLMQGYIDLPEKTAELLGGTHYRTSDVARRDADGYLWYVGRADDVFKASDYRLSPFELESAVIEHPAVAEAAVVPSPDPIRLAVPKAFVVLKPGFEPGPALAQDILAFLRDCLAPYKRIRRLAFTELPKTISGKIRRVELRRAEEERRQRGERDPAEHWEEDFTPPT
jgi:acetyl-CoA synthetase